MKDIIVDKLRELIDTNGIKYLSQDTFSVYKELVASNTADTKTAGAILYCLLNGIADKAGSENDVAVLSKTIQAECSFNKKMADKLSVIFTSLYSTENEERWNGMKLQGFNQFLSGEFEYSWSGFATWETSGGSIDCRYKADIELVPADYSPWQAMGVLTDNILQ